MLYGKETTEQHIKILIQKLICQQFPEQYNIYEAVMRILVSRLCSP
jgi:hypothetical protein